MTWFYLSFADGSKPKGQQWLGACIVKANTAQLATLEAHLLGINPGGSVAISVPERLPSMEWRNRLITTHDELREMGESITGDRRLLDVDGNEI